MDLLAASSVDLLAVPAALFAFEVDNGGGGQGKPQVEAPGGGEAMYWADRLSLSQT